MPYVVEMNSEECRETLRNAYLGRIGCSLNNQPYVVPFYFKFDGGDYLYAFSTVGQKILWMRQNPLVCIEVDEIKSQDAWRTIIAFGHYEELAETPEFESLRDYAHELVSRRPMWWRPAYIAGTHRIDADEKPVYFRIFIEKITGHQSVPEERIDFIPATRSAEAQKGWLSSFWLS